MREARRIDVAQTAKSRAEVLVSSRSSHPLYLRAELVRNMYAIHSAAERQGCCVRNVWSSLIAYDTPPGRRVHAS